MVLDACRDNPFASQMTITSGGKRSMSRGLAPVNDEDLSANSIIEYAAQSGTTASDGDPSAGHSPFASAFINHVAEPGVEITLLFGKVRDDVWSATNKSQRPASYGSHGGDPVYLVPPDARMGFGPSSAVRSPISPTPADVSAAAPQSRALNASAQPPAGGPRVLPELVRWQSVIATPDPAVISDYLAHYPNARYAALAKAHLAKLLAAPTPAAKTAAIMAQAHVLEGANDDAGALRLYQAAADSGSAAGQFWLATMYARGRGVEKDINRAAALYRLAADQGHAGAQYNLALIEKDGLNGGPPDYAAAKQLLEASAAQGDAGAQEWLGYMYSMAMGMPQDLAKSQEWYLAAAEGGSATALSNIGIRYAHGKFVQQDFALAAAWDQAAASRGSATAQANLGLLYFQGRGVPRDPDRARTLMTQAAAEGNATAIAWLKLNPG